MASVGRTPSRSTRALPLVRDPVVGDYVQQLGLSIARTTSRARSRLALPRRRQPRGERLRASRRLHLREPRASSSAPRGSTSSRARMAHEIGHVVRRHSVQQMEEGARRERRGGPHLHPDAHLRQQRRAGGDPGRRRGAVREIQSAGRGGGRFRGGGERDPRRHRPGRNSRVVPASARRTASRHRWRSRGSSPPTRSRKIASSATQRPHLVDRSVGADGAGA